MTPRSCRLLFVSVLLWLHALLAWQPGIMGTFGVAKLGPWFRDAYAMLAASDSARAGFDPFVENPYDLIHERHIYTHWWYALGKFGLDRTDYLWLGGLWVVLFWLAVLWVLPLANLRQTLVALAICASPPFWLIINRGNPDLPMFALLTLAAGLVLRDGKWSGRLAVLLVMLAAGLKYYPALGAVIVLWPTATSRERIIRITLLAVAMVGMAWSLRDAIANYISVGWLARGQLVFGAAALPMKLGLDGAACVRLGLIVGLGLAVWAVLQTRRESIPVEQSDRTGLLYLLGATLLIGNFFLTVGFLYKIIFAVWLLPAFLSWAQGTGLHRQFARFWLGTMISLLWLVPLTCLVAPFWLEWFGAASEAPVRRSVAAIADALTWVVVVPVLWLCIPIIRALAADLLRKAEA